MTGPRLQMDVDAMETDERHHTLMQRTAALEIKVAVLEKAMLRAFGRTWMDLLKEQNEPASE